ncbi:hypothetical protein [Streptomyces sp. NPDC002952]|uniref:terpene synthase family protein n=1 Tax=Streptomyces sp. NPDC002952 TaxID=3364673 RepID=UPI0036B27B1E
MANIPAFWCPIEPALNPAVDFAEEKASAWSRSFGMDPRYAETAQPARFTSYFTPTAEPDLLVLASSFHYWGFSFDDHIDHAPARSISRLLVNTQRALDIPEPRFAPTPMAEALQDLGNRLRQKASPSQARRVIEAHKTWLFGEAWRVSNQDNHRIPSLDEYLSIRTQDTGGEHVFQLVVVAEELRIPDDEISSLPLRALIESATLVAALDNDRHSFLKEYEEDRHAQHLFSVIRHQLKIDLDEAIILGCSIRDRIMSQCLKIREMVMSSGSSDAKKFAELVGLGIRGNIEWAASCGRYKSMEALAGITEICLDSTPKPVEGAPSIAWWWSSLDSLGA